MILWHFPILILAISLMTGLLSLIESKTAKIVAPVRPEWHYLKDGFSIVGPLLAKSLVRYLSRADMASCKHEPYLENFCHEGPFFLKAAPFGPSSDRRSIQEPPLAQGNAHRGPVFAGRLHRGTRCCATTMIGLTN